MPTLKKTALAVAAAFSMIPATHVMAYEEQTLRNDAGIEVLKLRFFNPQDGSYWYPDENGPRVSTWTLSENDKRNLLSAGQYWADVIRPIPGGTSGIINIGTLEDQNAYGGPEMLGTDEAYYSALAITLQGDTVPDQLLSNGAHGQFSMGRLDYTPGINLPSQLSLGEGVNTMSVAAHEIAHALGMLNTTLEDPDTRAPRFADRLDGWAAHLVDDNGNPAKAGQAILCAQCPTPYDPDAFDARQDNAFFIGDNVSEVLEGALPGVPVKMLGGRDGDGEESKLDRNYMSHIELKNSLMSHQLYRNYAFFMEAELALLEDLGYDIDRPNFFGRSVYGNGRYIVNDRGFFARNAEGTAYLPGEYNRSRIGLGLHVFGSNNTIRQTADLLSIGDGGAGMRIDGENNTVVIDPGVRVHANGLNGQGVIFAYGKGHSLIQRGDVQALGPAGVGLRFDFGNNPLGNDEEYRGSYIRSADGQNLALLPELQGALVDKVDLTGSVQGSLAAILISRNALVGEINVMQGARIEGDILSNYAQRDETGAWRSTTVSFGRQANAQGRSTAASDPNFNLRYDQNIRGMNNLNISLDGGITQLNGQNEVQNVVINQGAVLTGTASFALATDGTFKNAGVLAPGNAAQAQGGVAIDGRFEQTATGMLITSVTPEGRPGPAVTVRGRAQLDGGLGVRPEPGWYSSTWNTQTTLVQATTISGEFDKIGPIFASPTLSFTVNPVGQGRYDIAAQRNADAYSIYGTDHNSREAGLGLQRAAAQLGPVLSTQSPERAALGSFLANLDFSALDGSTVRTTLPQLSPAVYSTGLAASLQRERDIMNVALGRQMTPVGKATGLGASPSAAANEWQGFANAFGGKARQSSRDDTVGYDASTYGVVVGATRRLGSDSPITVGAHIDIAHQTVNPDASGAGKGRSTSWGVGLQAGYAASEMAGPYAWTGVRYGLDHASQKRSINNGSYSASHSADWTGHTASAAIGGGYRWALTPDVTFGPVASLDYTRVTRPGISESGPDATRLTLERKHVDAVRSRLGFAIQGDWLRGTEQPIAAYAQATWDREWKDRDITQTAAFAAVPEATFTSRNTLMPRNSLGLQAGLRYQPQPRLTVGATVNGRVGGGYKDISGQLNMNWAF